MKKYDKVKNSGIVLDKFKHRGLVVQEKLDGSNASFTMEDGELVCFSRRKKLYDMGKKPSNKHEIDRIDSDKNYSPDNCRWVTSTINNSNKKKRYLWGIHVNKNNTFRLSLSREYKRRDYTFSNVDTAVIYRDKWAKEYEGNPEHWIIRTLNGFYKEDIEDDYNVS